MRHKGWSTHTALALILILLPGFLYAQAASSPSAGAKALSTFTNAEYHFTFQYPSRLAPNFSFTTQQSWTFLDPGNKNGKSLSFDIFSSDNTADGGGTTKPWFAISQEVRVGISPDVADCYTPNDSTLPTVEAETINGLAFKVLRADVSAFSAMHTRQDATSYRIIHDAACFAVESVVEEGHEAASGNSGETQSVSDAVEAAATEADAIIHSFRFTDLSAAAPGAGMGPVSVPPGTPRVTFAAGATQGVVTGHIDAGATVGWLIGAAADQPLLLEAQSPDHDLTLSVTDMTSHALLFNTQPTASPWQAMLPHTGDYLIEIHGGTTSQEYRLTVTTPARIPSNADRLSVQRAGRTPGGLPVDFVLRIENGQSVVLALHTSGGAASLRAFALGADATSYVTAAQQTSARFMAAHDEDCIIEVVPADGAEVPFTLDVTIPYGRG